MLYRLTFTTALAAALMMITAPARAVFLSPDDWSTGWTRGEADTLYAEWDAFNANPDDAADVGLYHPPAGEPTVGSSGGFVTGGGFGGNLYGFNDTVTITASANNYDAAGMNTTVVVQFRTLGSTFDIDSVMLNGQAPTWYGELLRETEDIDFGASTTVEAWTLFEVAGTPNLTFEFTADGPHMSLDTLAIDAILTDASAGFQDVSVQGDLVPAPSTMAIGAGALAMLGLKRRRRR